MIKLRVALFSIEAAKVNALLLNKTLEQTDSLVKSLSGKPCAKSKEALKLLNSLIQSKNLIQLGKILVKIKMEFGSINNALKCLIGGAQYNIKENWNKVKKDLYNIEKKDLNTLKWYKELIKLVISG